MLVQQELCPTGAVRCPELCKTAEPCTVYREDRRKLQLLQAMFVASFKKGQGKGVDGSFF
jgi:hypothetical protein